MIYMSSIGKIIYIICIMFPVPLDLSMTEFLAVVCIPFDLFWLIGYQFGRLKDRKSGVSTDG
jgi:hypothetical protein